MLQLYKSDFILYMIKEVRSHESRSYWTLMRNCEVSNKHKNKDEKINTILSICSFKRKIFSDGRLMKHKSRLYAHGGIQQLGVN